MAGRNLNGAAVPTPGPWLVRAKADKGAPGRAALLGVEPETEDGSDGGPYLICQDRNPTPGDCPVHLASGIQRFADARLMAAAPDLAAALLRLLTSPALTQADPDLGTREALMAAWSLLVRVAPHLELWAEDAP